MSESVAAGGLRDQVDALAVAARMNQIVFVEPLQLKELQELAKRKHPHRFVDTIHPNPEILGLDLIAAETALEQWQVNRCSESVQSNLSARKMF